jgi:haloalkane dehalogenase
MPVIRTPEERFANLSGYPFEPHYLDLNDVRLHYVDEGAGQVILCLHGEPTWSYLYRKMIPILVPQGRVVAPDFIGFGKSDKYTRQDEYSFQMHCDTLLHFIEMLRLTDITVVVQDWGGLIGLRVAAEMPERFARLVILNTFLPTGEEKLNAAFTAWRLFAKSVPALPIGRIIRGATAQPVSKEIIRGYEAPFPNRRYQAGAKVFPALVPISAEMPGAAAMKRTRAVLGEWTKPALVMFSDKDPILGGAHQFFRQLIPTAREQPEITIHDAAHFLQEDKGEDIAEHIVAFLERTGARS